MLHCDLQKRVQADKQIGRFRHSRSFPDVRNKHDRVSTSCFCQIYDISTLAVCRELAANSSNSNTVFLTISAFDLSPKSPIYAAVSLLTFIVAGLVSGQLGGILGVFSLSTISPRLSVEIGGLILIGHRCRAWLLSSIVFQTLVLLLATWSISPIGPNMTQHGRKWDWIYLFLIGLQGGPQVVMVSTSP